MGAAPDSVARRWASLVIIQRGRPLAALVLALLAILLATTELALVERLRHDEYVPVRAQAARALAKIGRVDVLPALESAAHEDTESSVAAAAREAIAALQAGRPG